MSKDKRYDEYENFLANVYVPFVIKSLGEEDSDGNYIFEVEASNENLDLQNQRIQQKALIDSKEYFITNGVVSDDHQHKRYDKDGNVISDKTKIIGEPVSVRTQGTRTFVKGKLYGAIEAAKPFIELLKAGSSRVKASVGGIMPTVRKNPDGTETVTAFKWNDLALTCSPVNYTVGSAVFAKSLSNVDFCKALSAGCGTDSATMSGGRALQGEDLEKSPANVIPEADAVNELMAAIGTEEVKTEPKMESFLVERGFSKDKARATVREIISQGGREVAKSVFEQTKELLKSLTGKKDCEDKTINKGEQDSKDGKEDFEPESDNELDFGDNDDGEGGEEPDNEDDDESNDDEDVKKSLPDCEDATLVLENILNELRKSNESMKAMKQRMDDYEAKQEDISKSVLEVAGTLNGFANTPIPRKSAMSIQKSNVGAPSGAFTKDDWDIAKSVLTAAVKANDITLEKSEMLSSACQKALHGGAMSREVWNEMSVLCKKYASN